MGNLINNSQSAFITGRSIKDNILLCHDIVRSFHLDKRNPRMCLKLDLSKAFDSVRWKFVETALKYLNFPQTFINCVMECITSPSFSVLINGKPCGFFNSTRGLRQGCPISPYLFCIVMEFFSATLTECAINGIIPTPFKKGTASVSQLLCADDVLIFTNASLGIADSFK